MKGGVLMLDICVVFGTRPEFIKLYPVIKELRKTNNNIIVINTNQQKGLISELNKDFNINFDYEYDSNFKETTLNDRLISILEFLKNVMVNADKVIVQGDTLSAFSAAIIAFNNLIEIYHIEAGLRTYDITKPFPEEAYRRMITSVSTHHFAVTEENKNNLLNEGIREENISVVGNTVYDTLNKFNEPTKLNKKTILVTCHRKENQGDFQKNLGEVLKVIAKRFDIEILILKHPNKKVQHQLFEHTKENQLIRYIDSLGYKDFVNLVNRMSLIISDSGGIVEEVIELGTPTIVIREKTERKEALKCSHIKMIYDLSNIERNIESLLSQKDSALNQFNPYKKYDNASKIIVDLITKKR